MTSSSPSPSSPSPFPIPPRVSNFNAGPGCLPLSVLQQSQRDLLSFSSTGMSIMEMSHRSKEFESILSNAQNDLRSFLSIPKDFRILFLQGGATTVFSAIPLNFLGTKKKAKYLVSGAWSKAAAEEAKKYGEIEIVGSNEGNKHTEIPMVNSEKKEQNSENNEDEYAFFHYCHNETVHGLAYHSLPPQYNSSLSSSSPIPLIADFSSCFCSSPIDFTPYSLIYAGAQKNVGPSGLTIVIVRDSLLKLPKSPYCPLMLNYETMVDKDSMYNTPPCWSIYIMGLVMKWLVEMGMEKMEQMNKKKAEMLYEHIDHSTLYQCIVKKKGDRSLMNVVFNFKGKYNTDTTLKSFISSSEKEGLVGLAGHRSVGGCRASLYNAVTLEDVVKLVSFMKKFEENLCKE